MKFEYMHKMDEGQLTGDDIILLKPGDKVEVHGLCGGGWLVGECVVSDNEEIRCHHGWMPKDFYLTNYWQYKIFRA
jgi:hypothetical protein